MSRNSSDQCSEYIFFAGSVTSIFIRKSQQVPFACAWKLRHAELKPCTSRCAHNYSRALKLSILKRDRANSRGTQDPRNCFVPASLKGGYRWCDLARSPCPTLPPPPPPQTGVVRVAPFERPVALVRGDFLRSVGNLVQSVRGTASRDLSAEPGRVRCRLYLAGVC